MQVRPSLHAAKVKFVIQRTRRGPGTTAYGIVEVRLEAPEHSDAKWLRGARCMLRERVSDDSSRREGDKGLYTHVASVAIAQEVFWLAVLYIVVRLTLAGSKAVLLAYYASLRPFSCSNFTYILRSAVAQPNLLARRNCPLMNGLTRRRRGRG
jgi:hypothetical protein